MTDLPPGWTETTLGEIAETSLGKMLDKGKATGEHPVPYLRNVNVQWGRIDLDDVLTMDITPEEREFFRLEPDDLLACEGGEVGRCAIWHGGPGFMAFQKALHRIRPYGKIEVKYLRYFLEYLSLTGSLLPYATGSTIKHLPQQQLRRLPIRLPPIEEQRRIVAALEDHLSRIEAGDHGIDVAGRRSRNLWLSVLNSLLSGDLIGYDSGPDVRAISKFVSVQGGIQKQQKRRPVKNKYPFLRVANVSRGGLDLEDVHEVELFEGELERLKLCLGDLLVVEGNGSPDQIGRAAMWHGEISNCVHQNHLIRVRPGSNLDPKYLELAWNAPRTREQLREVAISTSGLYTLSTAKVKSIRLPVPPREVQEQLVAEAELWRSHLDSTDQAIGSARHRSAALRKSLLAEAFSGQLVPQESGDEPASVLLKRIKAEHGAVPSRGRRTSRKTPQKETLL
jgi:type I restriction enzyme, S subunit